MQKECSMVPLIVAIVALVILLLALIISGCAIVNNANKEKEVVRDAVTEKSEMRSDTNAVTEKSETRLVQSVIWTDKDAREASGKRQEEEKRVLITLSPVEVILVVICFLLCIIIAWIIGCGTD